MSRILRFLMCLFCIVFIGDAVFAASYECPTYRKYTTCNEGYYLAYSYAGTAYNNIKWHSTPRAGNACRPCSVYDNYYDRPEGSYYCAGGTARPVLNTATITYNLNGGSGTTPDSESCKKEQTCTLNDGATTSFYRAGYVFKGWALTSTATSGFTSYTFTGSDTVYAVWEECGIGEYKPDSAQAAAACSQCPDKTPGFDYLPTTGNTSLTKCIQGIAKAADVNEYCATSSEATEQFDIQCQATSDGTWGDCAIGNTWKANPGSYVGIWKQEMPAEDVIENMCIPCDVGTYSEGGLINSCSACPENYRDIAATSQANCQGTFEKTGSQITPDMQTGCAERTLGTCSPGTCEYTKKYSGTIVNDCTPTDCTMPQTCTSAEENYYLDDGVAKSCNSFDSEYPYSDGGNITYPYCYRIDTNTGSQVNGPVPDGCSSVDSWYDCEPGTCQYKNYYDATDETCTPKNCEKRPETVVADVNHYVSGTSCPSCSSFSTRYPYSGGGTGGYSICYQNCSKDCTRQTCPSSAYSCTHGSSSTYGIRYYGDYSCDAPSSTCTLTVNSCKSGYYKSGNSCASCSGLGDGSYTMSANGNSSGSDACYKSCTRACTRPTCPDNATCSYDDSLSTSGTQYYGGSCSAESSTCTMTVTCDPGYYKNSSGTCNRCGGNAYYCPGDNNRYSVEPGHYSTGGTSTTRTGQEECTGAKYCTGGVQKSCPLATYGWTRNGGTGWTSYTQCNQTRAATSASSYCSAGTLKQNATSATAWGETTVSEALSAKAGAYVNGTTCSQCTANDYCTGGTADRKDCPSGYPNSAAGSDAITDCYSNTKSRPWTGGMVNGDVPTNCSEVTEWGTCSKSACEYVAYSNSAGTADGTLKSGCKDNRENCVRPVVAVAAKSGYYDAGTTCSACPNGYPNSANGNEGGASKCYASVSGGHYIGTKNSATQSECVGGTYKAAHTVYYGSTSSCAVCGINQYSDDGAASCTACKTSAGYGNSGTTADSHDGVASCKVTCDAGEYVPTAGGGCVAVGSGYYKTGTMTVAQNATNTTRSACSSLTGVSVSGGTYSSVSPYNASTTCRYKAPDKTITGCAAVTTATVAYSGSAWPATTYTVSASSGYYISGSDTASATCVGCQAGYACTGGTAAPDACDGQTEYQDAEKQSSCKTVSSGWYKVDNTKQAQCTGATYCTGGVQKSCPSGYTANTTAGKTAASSCQISCSGGTYVATAEAACTSVGTGYYRAAHTVNYGSTSTRTQCPANYRSGAAASSESGCKTSCSGGTYVATAEAACTSVGTGYYRAAHTVNYGSTSTRTQCPANYRSGAAASSESGCKTSCAGGTYVATAEAACTAVGDGYYRAAHSVSYGSTSTRNTCPSGYPNSDAGATAITSCYSDEKSRPWSGGMVNGDVPTNCSEVTEWGTCSKSACEYVAYSNSAGTADGTVMSGCKDNSEDCVRPVVAVAAKSGYYDAGTTCSACPDGYPNSANGNEGGASKCYMSVSDGKYIATANATTASTCAAGTYKAAHTVYYGSTSSCAVCGTNQYSDARASVCIACNTADGYGNYGTTAASHAGQASCKVTCGGGEYVPTAGGGCVNVGVGYWGAGGTVSETSTLARSQCERGLTTIGSGAGADEAGDCGRVLNVNGEKIYLRSERKTTPSLNVSINGTTFYGNMGASSIGALKLKSNGTIYSVYDDSMQ